MSTPPKRPKMEDDGNRATKRKLNVDDEEMLEGGKKREGGQLSTQKKIEETVDAILRNNFRRKGWSEGDLLFLKHPDTGRSIHEEVRAAVTERITNAGHQSLASLPSLKGSGVYQQLKHTYEMLKLAAEPLRAPPCRRRSEICQWQQFFETHARWHLAGSRITSA